MNWPEIGDAYDRWLVKQQAKDTAPSGPLQQGQDLDPMFIPRDHLAYLSDRLKSAVERVEQGETVYIAVSMPPRSGKTTLISKYLPAWVLRKHPDWPIILTSYSPTLATSWGRFLRRLFLKHVELGVKIAPDAGAASEWETTDGGSVLSRSLGGQITGRGAKVLVIDDPHKGLAEAHSEIARDKVWDWWQGEAYTRLDRGGHLVVVVMTRWHEDDLIGRLTSPEYQGDVDQWEIINLPAIAEEADILGRNPGDPLMSPQAPHETREQAIGVWAKIKKAVGSYVWSALYQGSPTPSKGQIFDVSWFRYWTNNEANVTEDGRVVYLNPTALQSGKWTDSWDMAFKGKDDSDYVVGQRWLHQGANHFLVQQHRERMRFTTTLSKVKSWSTREGTGARVYRRLVEDKANGTAIIDTLRDEISGMIPINPTDSKVARARAVTPEPEAGNVLLPYPGDPGNEWVPDFLNEVRAFPTGVHDDQVDAMTQYLNDARGTMLDAVASPEIATMSLPGI